LPLTEIVADSACVVEMLDADGVTVTVGVTVSGGLTEVDAVSVLLSGLGSVEFDVTVALLRARPGPFVLIVKRQEVDCPEFRSFAGIQSNPVGGLPRITNVLSPTVLSGVIVEKLKGELIFGVSVTLGLWATPGPLFVILMV
jgi:hypothetical protein